MEEWILKHPVRKTLSLAEPGLKLFSPCRIYFMGIPSLTQPDVEWLVLWKRGCFCLRKMSQDVTRMWISSQHQVPMYKVVFSWWKVLLCLWGFRRAQMPFGRGSFGTFRCQIKDISQDAGWMITQPLILLNLRCSTQCLSELYYLLPISFHISRRVGDSGADRK